jgi:cytochrome c oxidase subunit 2
MNGDTKTNATACGGCHTLAEAGTNGQVGPNLDKALKGKDAAFIQQSIEDPNAVIAPGFSKDIMPPNYKETLSAAQIKALVDYLGKVTK